MHPRTTVNLARPRTTGDMQAYGTMTKSKNLANQPERDALTEISQIARVASGPSHFLKDIHA